MAALDGVIGQLSGDPLLSTYTGDLTTAQGGLAGAGTPSEIQTAITNLGHALESLDTVLSDLAKHDFTLGMVPSHALALPQTPAHFDILLQNTGSETTTYDFSVSGLPAGVTAVFNRPSVTLKPGEAVKGGPEGINLTLTETGNELVATGFTVTATPEGAPEIARRAQGELTVRDEFVRIVRVVADPPFTDPGHQVVVYADVLNAVNKPQTALISFALKDPGGQTVYTSTPVSISLTVQASLTRVGLGILDTQGLSLSNYSIDVIITDPSGQPIPGGVGQGSLLLGAPVTVSQVLFPDTLPPPGTATVSNQFFISARNSIPVPLSLDGLVDTDAIGTAVALDGSLAYVCGTEDVSIVDISDSSNPRVVKTFAGDVITKGGVNLDQIVGNQLLIGSQYPLNSSTFNLLIYSLADPLNPQLVSNTPVNYHFISDMFARGNTAFFSTRGVYSTLFEGITDQFGDFLSVDISDPTKPHLADVLFNNRGAPDGSDTNENGIVAVNDQIAYVAGSTSTGVNVGSGTGRLLVVNIADPADLALVRTLDIPGTVQLLDVAIHGDRRWRWGAQAALGTPSKAKASRATSRSRLWTSAILRIPGSSGPRSSRPSNSPPPTVSTSTTRWTWATTSSR